MFKQFVFTFILVTCLSSLYLLLYWLHVKAVCIYFYIGYMFKQFVFTLIFVTCLSSLYLLLYCYTLYINV